ncbi:hypothetical protein ACFVZH_08155 [Streptomyces sp. NPDC059534]|uniref:hypothetical protein n=1 Tax=Streptomyces sp. NPDC059534 TaxID=3346859 RepID=UPI00367BD29C
MAAVPTTQQFFAGEKVTASKLTAATKTPIDFLMNPPRANVYPANPAPVPTGSSVLIPFDGEQWDTDSMHSTTVNPSRITINTSGQYLVSIYARYPVHATGYRQLNLRLNSGGSSSAGSTLTTINVAAVAGTSTFITRTFELSCTAGDHYELFTLQTSGTTLNLDIGQRVTGMEFRWLSTT